MDNRRIAAALGLFLVSVMLCGVSGFLGYAYGYKVGQVASYSKGYDQGEEKGYQAGYDAGYKARQTEYKLEQQSSSGGKAVALRNPSYQEMKQFLAEDATESKAYSENQYVCVDFAVGVNNNAEEMGIRCAIVDIFHPDGYGHTIVAFETTDKGLIFIEPQFDREVKLMVGKSYSQINGFAPAPRDDTIVRYLIAW